MTYPCLYKDEWISINGILNNVTKNLFLRNCKFLWVFLWACEYWLKLVQIRCSDQFWQNTRIKKKRYLILSRSG